MNDDQLLRYSRHILLDDVGIEGQQHLIDSHVLVVGAGGLGSPVALYLAASGVGHITIADHDVVDLTNLQRQIAHSTDRVGEAKVTSAAQAMHALNPDVRITTLARQLDAAELDRLVPTVHVVVGRLQMLDGRGMEWNEMRVKRNPNCPVCGQSH